MVQNTTNDWRQLLNALRTNQPHCVLNNDIYLFTETPHPASTCLVLAIFNQNTSPERRGVHAVNTTYVKHLVELRPELNLLYHGYDPDDWRFVLIEPTRSTPINPTVPPTQTVPSGHEPDYQQVTLLTVPLTELLTLLPDLNELIAFLVSESDDHLVITRYAQVLPNSSETA